jgi:hypothetical protein
MFAPLKTMLLEISVSDPAPVAESVPDESTERAASVLPSTAVTRTLPPLDVTAEPEPVT